VRQIIRNRPDPDEVWVRNGCVSQSESRERLDEFVSLAAPLRFEKRPLAIIAAAAVFIETGQDLAD